MADLTDFGVAEPQDPTDADDDPSEERRMQWPECMGCGRRDRSVQRRLNQDVPLCRDCFADREGFA